MTGAHVKYRMALALIGATFAASAAYARDTIRDYPIDSALKSEEGKLDDGVALYFGDQPHPRVMKSYGTFATNKKTNAFGKSDEAACQHVFLSAVIELQARAQGGRQCGGRHQEQLPQRVALQPERVHVRCRRGGCRRGADGRGRDVEAVTGTGR